MSCHIAYTNNVPPQKTLLKRSTAALRSIGFSLLLGATLASGAQAQSTKFIPTFLVYYGGGPALGTADAAKLAKYDLIDIDRFRYDSIGSNTWSSIKALNPNTQIYLYEMGPESPSYLDSSQPQYVNGLARHNVSRGHPMGSLNGNQPGLFQKDAAGNRIYSKGYSNPSANQYWYLMDFGSSAYQSYWVTAVKADIIDQPWRADGVFVDNCTPNAAAAGYNATSAWYPTDAAWSTAMNSFIVAITAGVHGYGQKLWCNKGGTVSDAGSAAWKALDSGANPPDVLLEEGAFAVEWGANTQFFPEASWKRQIDTMGAIKNSKIALMSHTQLSEGQSGTDNWGKPVTFWQTLSYALGSFLLGKNDTLNNSYFMFNGGSGYNKIWWFDEYDKLNLGKALGTYKVSTINGVNIYSREFEKGYVYVNPTATNVASMTLPQASRQITHDNLSSAISSLPAVTTISLNGHYAAFLMKTGAATTDSTAPSVPAGLTATAASSTQINLAWTASTDNVGVTGYRVYRAGSLVATLGAVTSYQNAGLTAATSYNYTVQAIDAAGNASVQSSAASATTKTATTSDSTAPSLPAGLTATAASSTQINLAWTASTDNVGVTGYRVYRAGSLIATVGAVTSYQNTGLSAATSYAYTVQAFDAAGNASGQSNAASTTTKTATTSDTTAPSAPTSLTAAAASASQINLSWTASTDNVGVTGYRINRAGTPIATVGVVTSYQNTGLAAATSYNYTVQAIDAAGNVSSQSNATFAITSATSTADTAAPSVPAGLTVTAASSTQINLAWTASTDNVGVTGYRVYRAGSLIATLGAVTSYQNTGLSAATSYAYTVQAIDAAGNASAQSASASAITKAAADTTAPSVPTGLGATASSASQINLSWAASTDNVGVTGYRVYRAGALIATVGAVTGYQNTGLTASTSYAYTVQAIDAAGNASGQSNAASATTQSGAIPNPMSDSVKPTAPAGLTATAASSTQINLSWTASTDNVGVTGYRINRAGTPIATVGVVTSYQNTGLAAATSYNYTVQAIDAAGNVSSQSNATFAITPATSAADTAAPSVPTGLTASAVSGSQVKLTWQPSTDNVGVKGYIVYLNNAQLATITTGTSFQHTGLTPGTTYNYRVSAFDAVPNHSAWTATPVSVKTSTQ